VVVVAGPNGAGKSTTASALLRDTLAVTEFVNADVIAEGLSAFHPESSALSAGRIMLLRMRELAEKRADFAFETTLATRSFAPWLASLTNTGYLVHVVFLWLSSPELAVLRVRERVRAGGHDVPEETIRRRYYRGLRNFFELYRPLAAGWYLYDNSTPVGPRLIARGGHDATEEILDEACWKVARGSATR
jgi:predicted ABC-type ATPase